MTRLCMECAYDANPSTATHCEICGKPLQHNSALPISLSEHHPRRSSSQWVMLVSSYKWIVPILLTLLAVETGYFIWRRPDIATNSAQPAVNPNCATLDSIELRSNKIYVQFCKAMQEIPNVPQGNFFYGGTMAAAGFRSQNVLFNINRAHPEFHLRYLDPLHVAPDSATGIKMVINGDLSFAESQRPIREAEYALARSHGFTLKQIPVAITGIAFFTNLELHIPGLSLDQLQDIYTGKVTNWKQVGGPALPIVPISQDQTVKGSSLSLLFQGLPPKRQHLGQNLQFVRDTTATIREVAATPGAIGYGIQAIVVGQKTIYPIGLAKEESKKYVQPATPDDRVNKEAIRDATYPLIQRVFVIIRQDGELDEVAGIAYANLLLSNQGQQLIDQAGYVPMR
ncbi:MAG: substrate-binding domain-containing protein [Chroococcidiopsidaceae cyanobacterium CP_BM_RX_35]|nr:substrate-binding domain-containing protein [Chroococcidiopsidaceae cyanobacterium CP_BM_RX_35]